MEINLQFVYFCEKTLNFLQINPQSKILPKSPLALWKSTHSFCIFTKQTLKFLQNNL